MPTETAPHQLVIISKPDLDTYVASFADTADGSGVIVSTLMKSLADLDEDGKILDNWRTFLEALLRDCMSEITGYPRDAIEIYRNGLESFARLKEN